MKLIMKLNLGDVIRSKVNLPFDSQYFDDITGRWEYNEIREGAIFTFAGFCNSAGEQIVVSNESLHKINPSSLKIKLIGSDGKLYYQWYDIINMENFESNL